MTDRLEAELHDLGRHLDVPPAPDVTAAVRARITTRPRWYARSRRAYAVAAFLVAVLVLGATPPGRAVVTHVLRIAGVEIRTEPRPAPTGPGVLPGEEVVSLAQARRRVLFPVLEPAGLGPPGKVIVSDRGRVVSLVYGAVRIDEFDGRLNQGFFEKFIHVEPDVYRRTSVGGRPAVWIAGPHTLVYTDRSGAEVEQSARTSGSALVWQAGRVAIRLEGVADLARAREIGASIRAPS